MTYILNGNIHYLVTIPDNRVICNFYIVGSVKVNFLSYLYRVDKSTIFGMRGLWGLTINSGRGATLKYL